MGASDGMQSPVSGSSFSQFDVVELDEPADVTPPVADEDEVDDAAELVDFGALVEVAVDEPIEEVVDFGVDVVVALGVAVVAPAVADVVTVPVAELPGVLVEEADVVAALAAVASVRPSSSAFRTAAPKSRRAYRVAALEFDADEPPPTVNAADWCRMPTTRSTVGSETPARARASRTRTLAAATYGAAMLVPDAGAKSSDLPSAPSTKSGTVLITSRPGAAIVSDERRLNWLSRPSGSRLAAASTDGLAAG